MPDAADDLTLRASIVGDASGLLASLASVAKSIQQFQAQSATANQQVAQVFQQGAAQSQNALQALRGQLHQLNNDLNRTQGTLRQMFQFAGGQYLFQAFYRAEHAVRGFVSGIKEAALRTDELDVVLQNLARQQGKSIAMVREQVAEIRKYGITLGEAQNQTIQFMRYNLPVEKAGKLARVAQDAAVLAGADSSATLQRLMWGIQTRQIDVLRTAGINLTQEQAFRQWLTRPENKGKSMRTMTERERQEAMLDAILAEGEKIAGTYEASMLTPGKQRRSLPRYMDDIRQELGKQMMPLYTAEIFGARDLLKKALKEIQQGGELTEPLNRLAQHLASALQMVVDKMLDGMGKAEGFIGRIIAGVDSMVVGITTGSGAWGPIIEEARKFWDVLVNQVIPAVWSAAQEALPGLIAGASQLATWFIQVAKTAGQLVGALTQSRAGVLLLSGVMAALVIHRSGLDSLVVTLGKLIAHLLEMGTRALAAQQAMTSFGTAAQNAAAGAGAAAASTRGFIGMLGGLAGVASAAAVAILGLWAAYESWSGSLARGADRKVALEMGGVNPNSDAPAKVVAVGGKPAKWGPGPAPSYGTPEYEEWLKWQERKVESLNPGSRGKFSWDRATRGGGQFGAPVGWMGEVVNWLGGKPERAEFEAWQREYQKNRQANQQAIANANAIINDLGLKPNQLQSILKEAESYGIDMATVNPTVALRMFKQARQANASTENAAQAAAYQQQIDQFGQYGMGGGGGGRKIDPVSTWGKAFDWLISKMEAVRNEARIMGDALLGLGQTVAKFLAPGASQAAAGRALEEQIDKTVEGFKKQAQAMAEAEVIGKDQASMTKFVNDRIDELAGSLPEAVRNFVQFGDEMMSAGEKAQFFVSQIQAGFDQINELSNASMAVEEGFLDLQDKMDNYRRVMANPNRRVADEVRAANEVRRAMQNQVTAIVNQAKALAEAGQIGNDTASIQEYVNQQLEQLKQQYPELAAEIQQYADSVQELPERQETLIEVLVQGALDALDKVKKALDDLPKRYDIEVGLQFSGGGGGGAVPGGGGDAALTPEQRMARDPRQDEREYRRGLPTPGSPDADALQRGAFQAIANLMGSMLGRSGPFSTLSVTMFNTLITNASKTPLVGGLLATAMRSARDAFLKQLDSLQRTWSNPEEVARAAGSFQAFAEGGLVTRPQVAVLGERWRRELVLPLENPAALRRVVGAHASELGRALGMAGFGGGVPVTPAGAAAVAAGGGVYGARSVDDFRPVRVEQHFHEKVDPIQVGAELAWVLGR